MSVMLKKVGCLENSVQNYRSATKAGPDMKETYNKLANALRDNNASDGVEQTIEHALGIWPDYGELYNTHGVTEQQPGRQDHAVASYRRAIDLNPNLSKAFHNLTAAKRVTADDPIVALITARAVDLTLSDHDRINYNFALGKVLADLKCDAESYTAIERGNMTRKAELGYTIGHDQILFENIKTAF